MNDLTVVIPVHKEDPETVSCLYLDLVSMGCQVIIVDDGHTMDLPPNIPSIHYVPHMGYGYALKQGIKASRTPIVCTLDGDGQHSVLDVKKLYTVYKLIKDCKMIVGCRWGLTEKPHRRWGRKVLNFLATCMAGHYLIDLNSGLRIFDAELARGYSPILCDTFSFTTSLTMSMVTDNHKIAWFPIEVKDRASGRSHVKVVKDGLITLWFILWIGIALRTRNLRKCLRSPFGR